MNAAEGVDESKVDNEPGIGAVESTESMAGKRRVKLTMKGCHLAIDQELKIFAKKKREVGEWQEMIGSMLQQGKVSEATEGKVKMAECLEELRVCCRKVKDLESEAGEEVHSTSERRMNELDRIEESVWLTSSHIEERNKEQVSRGSQRRSSTRKTRSGCSRNSIQSELMKAEAELAQRKVEEKLNRERIERERRRFEKNAVAAKERMQFEMEEERRKFEESLQDQVWREKLERDRASAKFETYRKCLAEQELGSDDPGSENEEVVNQVNQPLPQVETESKYIEERTKRNWHYEPVGEDRRERVEADRMETRQRDIGEISEQSEVLTRDSDSGTQQLLQLLMEQNAPEADIRVFKGDPLEFRLFMKTFEAEVERKIPDNMGRLNRLIKFTGGLPQKLVQPYIYDPNGYDNAKKELRVEFANEHKISNAYNNQIREWPPIKPSDGNALQEFYLFLCKAKHCLESTEFQAELNTQDNLRKCAKKLPTYLQDSWNRKATLIYEVDGRKPSFEDFGKFVKLEQKVADNPTFSRGAMNERDSNFGRKGDVHQPRGYHSAPVRNSSTAYGSRSQEYGERKWPLTKTSMSTKVGSCEFCQMSNHVLDNCYNFRKEELEKRRQFVQSSKLCFGCLQSLGPGHAGSRTCGKKLVCSICKRMHPTCLHQPHDSDMKRATVTNTERSTPKPESNSDGNGEAANVTGLTTGVNCARIGLACVLVEIENERTGRKVKTHCFLDSMSNGSFIDENLCELVCDDSSYRKEQVTLTTLDGVKRKGMGTVKGLKVRGTNGDETGIKLPKLYVLGELPVGKEDMMSQDDVEQWPHLRHLVNQIPEYDPTIAAGLLLGNDVPRALEPYDCIRGTGDEPYGVKYRFGWSITGPTNNVRRNLNCAVTHVVTDTGAHIISAVDHPRKAEHEEEIKVMLKNMYERDFLEVDQRKTSRSKEDDDFMEMMEEKVELKNGRYYLPLPVRDEDKLQLPDNRRQAYETACRTQKRLKNNTELKEKYVNFMTELVVSGQASKVPDHKLSTTTGFGNHCFLNYHDVKHPQKPSKFRIVFNASKEFKNESKESTKESLNSHLLQGPTIELTNSLIGVLMRFRKHDHAFMADIRGMFNQTRVFEDQRKYLRFYWWSNKELNGTPEEFEMHVHLFGAVSSPSCANYALRRTALDHAELFSEECVRSVLRNFYVDDILKSVSDKEVAKKLTVELCELLNKGGFELHKFQSPDPYILSNLAAEKVDHAQKSSLEFEKGGGDSVMDDHQRVGALGLQWDLDNDRLEFRISMKDHPFTRRGMLSYLSAIYDPLGLAAPFLLHGKRILHELTKMKFEWDDRLDESITERWMNWKDGLNDLRKIQLSRCVTPKNWDKIKTVQLHGFADASEYGYGVGLYLRLENVSGEIHVSLIQGKSRLVPVSGETIPRLELVASLLAAEMSSVLASELEYENLELYLWTDSKVVLAYLANKSKRFKTFVANRVRKILQCSDVENWNHVPTGDNPADHASRGLDPRKAAELEHDWFQGPKFLWKCQSEWPKEKVDTSEIELPEKEVKRSVLATEINERKPKENPILRIVETRSEWCKMTSMVASLEALAASSKRTSKGPINLKVENLKNAERTIIKAVQNEHFSKEISLIRAGNPIQKSSSLYRLSPILDCDGLLRIGGRLTNSELCQELKHGIILPKFSIVTDAILRHCHERMAHGGRNATLNELRVNGYWIIQANSKVRSLIFKCVRCRQNRGKLGEQKMSDLPEDRATEAPPFSYVGVDCFGPFLTKRGRKKMKRYGVIYTDLVYRSVHLEMVESMDTDSFINSLRRFIARRGPIRLLRSDNGTNFCGAYNELKLDDTKITNFLHSENADFEWKFNTPRASHHGGVWERQIRSVRRSLEVLLKSNPAQLTDEGLGTLLVEVEGIVNSRPLSCETMNDKDSPAPLSPIQLLTQKTKVILPPPGNFEEKADMYSKRQWRRVQHFAQQFWGRFRTEYLTSLQSRTKWTESQKNFRVGDLVLLKEDSVHRNQWPLGVVTVTYPNEKGQVRSVRVKIARKTLKDTPKFYDRPITKIVLLLESESVM